MDRTHPQHHTFSKQLSSEWEYLRRRPSELARARSWRHGLAGGPPAGRLAVVLNDLVDLEEILRTTDSPNRTSRPSRRTTEPTGEDDAALLQLIEIARNDQLAGRIVIQRLLPGLIAHGARYRSHQDDIDPAEVVVAAAWIALHRYDTNIRCRHVAASLISDATFQAFRQPLRRRSASEETVPLEHFDQQPTAIAGSTAFEQLADVVRLACTNGVPAADVQLVRDLVHAGSAKTLAERNGVTARTIRNRRDRAVANIRRAVLAA